LTSRGEPAVPLSCPPPTRRRKGGEPNDNAKKLRAENSIKSRRAHPSKE
jgi:hypothetical protein